MKEKGETNSTYSTQKSKPLTIEDIKKAAESVNKIEEKPLRRGLNWFTRLMARFGWHRKYTIILFDRSRFGGYWWKNKPGLKIKDK